MLVIYRVSELSDGSLYQNPMFCNPPLDVAEDDSNVVFHYAMLKKERPNDTYIVVDTKDLNRPLSKEELLKKLYRIP